MKNPMMSAYMSAWHSAANQITGPARGTIMAEMQKAQSQMMTQRVEMWMAAMMPWAQGRKK